MRPERGSSLWQRWTDRAVRHRRLTLALVLATTFFFSYALIRLRVSSEITDFLRTDTARVVRTLRDRFEIGAYHGMIFESQSGKSLFEPSMLREAFRILQEIKKRHKVTTMSPLDAIDEGLRRTRKISLSEVDDYATVAHAILALSGPKTVFDLERVSRRFLSNPEAIDFYAKLNVASAVAPLRAFAGARTEFPIPDVRAMAVYMRLDPSYPPAEQKRILADIRHLTEVTSPPDFKVYHHSEVLSSYDVDAHARANALWMALILCLVDASLLWGLFRSGREVGLTLFILVTACLWSFGAAALLGIKISFLHLIALPILLGTGIDDSIVFGWRLAEERRSKGLKEAIQATQRATGRGIFLTTFTTFLAFLSGVLTSSAEALRGFYLLVALSMAVVFLLTVILQEPMRAEASRGGPSQGLPGSRPPANRLLDGLSRFATAAVVRRPRETLAAGLLLLLLSGVGILHLKPEFDRRVFLKRTMPTFEADRIQDRYFGREISGYLLLEGEVENPALLEKMKRLKERMRDYPIVQKVLGEPDVESVDDLIRKMGLSVPPAVPVREIFDRITESGDTANYVLNETYQEAAKHLVRKTGDRYDALAMEFVIQERGGEEIRQFLKSLERDLHELGFKEVPGIRVSLGGGAIAYRIDEGAYFRSFIYSFLVSVVINFLVLWLFWKNIWTALLAMIPVLFSVALTMGVMPLVGLNLNVLNLCIGVIVVGLGVDYPIHVIERFHEELERAGPDGRLRAVETAMNRMGPSLWAAALTTIVGFSAACVLALPIAENFGLLTGFAILVAYLASIFLLPSLLRSTRLKDPGRNDLGLRNFLREKERLV
ncbi:MAG TPA: efflux RND transporter permease subunit [bacterium]|nr:efflux RND transporter permease subunit [bacterium]